MKKQEQLRYPIQYAIMPIEEQTGWAPGLNELEGEYGVVVNIVSKCYVISEKKEYLRDGTSKTKYEVVFPYDKKDSIHYGGFQFALPEYNFYSQCTNSIFVDRLFNNFDDALAVAERYNHEILHHKVGCLSYDENFKKNLEELKLKHQETLDRYKEIEKIIEQETSDMTITGMSHLTLENIIDKIVECPSDFYSKLAYELSDDERDYLKQFIENKECSSCTDSSCSGRVCEFNKAQDNNHSCWHNAELIGRQFVLIKTK